MNGLKEIEQQHKEENGKLRVELEQEKARNEKLQYKIDEKELIIDGMKEDRRIAIEEIREEYYISKDKIIEKIKELEQQIAEFKEYVKDSKGQEKTYWRRELAELVGARNSLRGLLEEK